MEFFYQLKIWAIDLTQLDRDSLHVHVSVAAYLIACLILRQKTSSVWPWLAVLFLALLGEYLDGQRLIALGVANYPNQGSVWEYHGSDMINTMIAPTMLLFAARFTQMFEGKQRFEAPPEKDVSNENPQP